MARTSGGLARVLIEDGKHAEASDVIARFETIAQDRFEIEALKAYLAFQEGQIARLITHGQAAYELRPDDPRNATWLGFGYQILGDTDRAVAVLPERELMSKLAFTGDYEGVAAEAIRRGPELWSRRRDARTAINVLSALGRHSDILRLYDQRYRSLDEFLRHMPIHVSVAPELAVAFREAGRDREADAILKASLRPLVRNPVEWGLHSSRVFAAAGHRERALAALEEAVEKDFLYIAAPPFQRPSDYPLLRQMKGHPRLQQIDARYLQTINKERAKLGWPPLRDYPQ